MMHLNIRTDRFPALKLSFQPGDELHIKPYVRELDYVELALTGLEQRRSFRLLIGDVAVQLTRTPEYTRTPDGLLSVQWKEQQFFERWAGHCTVSFIDDEDPDYVLCRFTIMVSPSKLRVAELDHMLEELSRFEIGLILDVYGKSTVAVNRGTSLVGLAPEFFLRKVEALLTECRRSLPEIRRRPHSGYRKVLQNAHPLASRPLHPAEAAVLCRSAAGFATARTDDSSAISVAGRSVAVMRGPRSETVQDLDVYEHRALRWFLLRIRRGLLTLRDRALHEHARRNSERPDWWSTEDEPRLMPLLERGRRCTQYSKTIDSWLRHEPGLTAAGSFSPPLRSTPASQRQAPYRRLYQIMKEFPYAGEFIFAGDGERYKAQNLSALYEYWASLKMLWYLVRRFRVEQHGLEEVVDTDRFILTLKEGYQALFKTGDDRWIRFRYEPAYECYGTPGVVYGRLSAKSQPYRPDIALEVLAEPGQVIPTSLLVFDVKYKRDKWNPALPVKADLEETAAKYLNGLGRFDNGAELTKHSWIIYPSDRKEPWTEQPLFDKQPLPFMRTRGAVPLLPGFEETFDKTLDRLLDFEGLLQS